MSDTEAPGARARILFVDDEARILSGLRRQLWPRRDLWHMAFLEGGVAALAEMEQEPADVVVTDMRMPGMDGAQLLALVTQRWPRTARLVLSGHADPGRMQLARSCAHRYLNKPCPPETLEKEIDTALSMRARHDALTASGVGEVWSRPPRLVEGCAAVLDGAGEDEARFDPEHMFAGDEALLRRVQRLAACAFPAVTAADAGPEELGRLLRRETLFPLAMAVRFFDAFMSGLDGGWETAERVGAAAARITAKQGHPQQVVGHALLAGLLHSVELPGGAESRELLAYLLPTWGIPDPVVLALAWHSEPDRCPQATVLKALLQAEREVGEAAPPLPLPAGAKS